MSEFLTAEEVANELRITTRHVHELCKAGKIGFTKPGGKYLIPRESLDYYLKVIR